MLHQLGDGQPSVGDMSYKTWGGMEGGGGRRREEEGGGRRKSEGERQGPYS